MPRSKFKMAPDAAERKVDCSCYSFNGGAPSCSILNRPWCLAPGTAPEACKFRRPQAEDADHGQTN